MSAWVDPWVEENPQLRGPWKSRIENMQRPCFYCSYLAIMNEPSTGRKAHKVCSERAAGKEDAPVGTGPYWDGEDKKLTSDGPHGCGGEDSPVVTGRRCGGTGTAPTCQLCPNSPTYWRRSG